MCENNLDFIYFSQAQGFCFSHKSFYIKFDVLEGKESSRFSFIKIDDFIDSYICTCKETAKTAFLWTIYFILPGVTVILNLDLSNPSVRNAILHLFEDSTSLFIWGDTSDSELHV